jgi:SAM-dependent methyltransferase
MASKGYVMDGVRLARERDFHNEFFGHEQESRAAQNRYYFAIEHGVKRCQELLHAYAKDRDVLEFGCGNGWLAQHIAQSAKSIVGIDLSDVVVSQANERCAREGVHNARFAAMDAEAMTFPDETFDLVFGSAILHHLDVPRSVKEIHRVLRPGGVTLFWEPLGHNPILNLYRRLTPTKRTDDEHPLVRSDIKTVRELFPDLRMHYFGLLTPLSVPLVSTPLAVPLRAGLDRIDRALIGMGLHWYCWYVLIEAKKTGATVASQ